MRFKRPIVFALVAVAALTALSMAQDPHKVGPTIYKQKLENAKTRVYEITFKPGAEIAMHGHPDHVVYVVSPGTLLSSKSVRLRIGAVWSTESALIVVIAFPISRRRCCPVAVVTSSSSLIANAVSAKSTVSTRAAPTVTCLVCFP